MSNPVNSLVQTASSPTEKKKESEIGDRITPVAILPSRTGKTNSLVNINGPDAVKPPRKTGIPRAKNYKLIRSAKSNWDKKQGVEEKGKRTGSVIMDRIPAKRAQRTKGSTTIEKIGIANTKSTVTKSKIPVEQFSRSTTRENKPAEEEGAKVTLKTEEKMSKAKLKPLVKESKSKVENAKSISALKKSEQWSFEKETNNLGDSEASAKEDEIQEICPMSASDTEKPEDKNPSHSTFIAAAPSPAYSFFEKIQQGVKSYFSSRNSIRTANSTDEKNKTRLTEGGTSKLYKQDCNDRTATFSSSRQINFIPLFSYILAVFVLLYLIF